MPSAVDVDEELADRTPIGRLRRVAGALARLQSPHPADAAWFAIGVQRYEAACRAGFDHDLGRVLGLAQQGRVGWATEEARARRDALLRELHSRHFPDLSPGRAAIVIARLAREAQQVGLSAVQDDPQLALVAEALMTGQALPAPRQLKRILQ